MNNNLLTEDQKEEVETLLRAHLGEEKFQEISRVDIGLLRDLSQKITDDVTDAITRTASLPGVSLKEKFLLIQVGIVAGINIASAGFVIITGTMTHEQARMHVLDLLRVMLTEDSPEEAKTSG